MSHDQNFKNLVVVNPRGTYRSFLDEALTAAAAGDKQGVSHEYLLAVFELLVGSLPSTGAKLCKRLGHQGMQIIPHTRGGSSERGFGVHWQAEPGHSDAWRALLEAKAQRGFTQRPSPDEPPAMRRPLATSEPEDAAKAAAQPRPTLPARGWGLAGALPESVRSRTCS
jgi:hypothetical protein